MIRVETTRDVAQRVPVTLQKAPLSPAQVTNTMERMLVVQSLIHISEPTRPLSISYAAFCLKKKIFATFAIAGRHGLKLLFLRLTPILVNSKPMDLCISKLFYPQL